jgi:hypothetical protein
MPLIEDGSLFANLTLSYKKKESDEKPEAIKAAKELGESFATAIINGTKAAGAIEDHKVGDLMIGKASSKFIITFKMPSKPQTRLDMLTAIYKAVNAEGFEQIDILNGTLSYNDDDGVLISRRVEEGTREHGALFGKPFVQVSKVGDSRADELKKSAYRVQDASATKNSTSAGGEGNVTKPNLDSATQGGAATAQVLTNSLEK